MVKILDIVYRTLATHITKKAGYNKQTAQTGAVTLIQRFDGEHPLVVQKILSHLNTKNDEVVASASSTKSSSASDKSVCIKAVHHHKQYSELVCTTAGDACLEL